MDAGGRPELFKDDQKELVTNLWNNNPKVTAREAIGVVTRYLIDEEKKILPKGTLEQDVRNLVETKLLSKTAIIAFLTKLKKHKVPILDANWTTSSLINEELSPQTVRWLIALQVYRKSYFSKPLTVREAKWFNRLSGFRSVFSNDLSDVGISQTFREVYISSVIATWAQMYAYRETINNIAGISKLDFSDMDDNLAKLNFEAIQEYNDKWLMSVVSKAANDAKDDNLTKEEFEKLSKQCFLPSLFAQIRQREMQILGGYCLGTPDMSVEVIGLYAQALTTIFNTPAIIDRLVNLPCEFSSIQRKNFLTLLREEVKNNPDTPEKNFDKGFIELFLKIAKKDGEVNG